MEVKDTRLHETVEEFLSRGGEITVCEQPETKKREQRTRLAKKNINRRYYDYSDSDYPMPLEF